jgi:SAM-dependent methyltransferase
MGHWFEDDGFWQAAGPFMFTGDKEKVAEAQVDWMIEALNLKPGARVLDLCCGIGRHAVLLARKGFDVTGVDISEGFLAQARKRADEAGVKLGLVRKDMMDIDFESEFDVVLNVFTSFGFFPRREENQEVMSRIARSLKPGGLFLLDTINRDWILKNFRERTWSEQGGVYHLSESKYDPATEIMTTRWIFLGEGKPSESVLTHYVMGVKGWADMCEAAGLKTLSVYGNLVGEEFQFDSRRVVILAGKIASS